VTDGTPEQAAGQRPQFGGDRRWGEAVSGVPPQYADRFREIITRTDRVCDTRLNTEYKALCSKVAVTICQKGSPVLGGKPEGWVAGIVYALGQVNFLTDPNQQPHLTAADIVAACQVSQATMMNRARELREALDLMPLDPHWCLPSLMEGNPLVWMLEVNGFVIDIRHSPRDVQVAAFEQGLIPYIPADHKED
jgi:hypothetical protein